MKRAEKRQKFHNALLHMLYPPPEEEEDDPESVNTSSHNLKLDDVSDELEEPTSSTDGDEYEDGGDHGTKKLTRSQRKRLRKKKLKEAASHRRKIIGPLLPTSSCEGDEDATENGPQGVRENAIEGIDSLAPKPDCEESEEIPSGPKQNKIKQRRMAKKVCSESMKFSSTKSYQQRDNS